MFVCRKFVGNIPKIRKNLLFRGIDKLKKKAWGCIFGSDEFWLIMTWLLRPKDCENWGWTQLNFKYKSFLLKPTARLMAILLAATSPEVEGLSALEGN